MEDFSIGSRKYFKDERFWLVRLPSGAFAALENKGDASRCAIEWRPDQEFMGLKGWFVDTCDGTHYDLTGACFEKMFCYGPARSPVRVSDGVVTVNLMQVHGDEHAYEPGDQPVNPPQQ